MVEKIITKSAEETQKFAEGFAKKIHGGDVILLYGNLGAGKTTFVQGLAKGLGITHRIISPTFIIMRTYSVVGNKDYSSSERSESRSFSSNSSRQARTINNFYHVDLYRLQSEKDIDSIGLFDLIGKKENIIIIEWPEKFGPLLPKNAWQLHFDTEGEDSRLITVEK